MPKKRSTLRLWIAGPIMLGLLPVGIVALLTRGFGQWLFKRTDRAVDRLGNWMN